MGIAYSLYMDSKPSASSFEASGALPVVPFLLEASSAASDTLAAFEAFAAAFEAFGTLAASEAFAATFGAFDTLAAPAAFGASYVAFDTYDPVLPYYPFYFPLSFKITSRI